MFISGEETGFIIVGTWFCYSRNLVLIIYQNWVKLWIKCHGWESNLCPTIYYCIFQPLSYQRLLRTLAESQFKQFSTLISNLQWLSFTKL
jgi:hypothetical protein